MISFYYLHLVLSPPNVKKLMNEFILKIFQRFRLSEAQIAHPGRRWRSLEGAGLV
jgi:hypothetical protein